MKEQKQKKNEIKKMQSVFHSVLYNYFTQRKIRKDFFIKKVDEYFDARKNLFDYDQESERQNILKKEIASIIIYLFYDLRKIIDGISEIKNRKTIKIENDFDYQRLRNLSIKYRHIKSLGSELEKISDFIETFFIHGSFATKDFLEGWSDLDTTLIFKDKLFEDENNLRIVKNILERTKMFYLQVDPLAHHFTHLATSLDLKYYPQSIMPLSVYENGMVFLGKKEVEINVRDDEEEKIKGLEDLRNYFKRRINKKQKNDFDSKLNLSHVLLLPSFFLQMKGVYVYKKFSFEKVKKEFSEIDFGVVDEVSEIRKNWNTTNLIKYYPSYILPYFLNKLVVYTYVKFIQTRKTKIKDEKMSGIIRNSYVLMDSFLNNCIKK
jgi:hypothetical protein